jgi:hypothetical protein
LTEDGPWDGSHAPQPLRSRALFCEACRDLLARTGLPRAVTHTEHRFRDLLERGKFTVREGDMSLGQLSEDRWAAFYQFVAAFFREFESFAPEDLFPAFRLEVDARGDKFPR